MSGHDETMAILRELKDISNASGEFVTGILEDSLTYDEQINFALRLVRLAEQIKARADRTPVVVDGEVINGNSSRALPGRTDGQADYPDPIGRD
ncbi:hypothetical protein KIF24_24175 [Micromonospora sp. Llam7]|uniref:hypothetical protein n=1 Tax=Micromonospora tarapacensis TaxID=2835305 RepID=UPI001C840963|nr:hypothetical protein [Micromonospora tarapacensis]MBX7268810.1 hypothetical protein [Micromonospora tarapacensis]